MEMDRTADAAGLLGWFGNSGLFRGVARFLIFLHLYWGMAVQVAAQPAATPPAATPPPIAKLFVRDLVVGHYRLAESRRISASESEYSFTAWIDNPTSWRFDRIHVTLFAAGTATIVDGELDFGAVAPGERAASRDRFTLRAKTGQPIEFGSLLWTLGYDRKPVANAGTNQTVEVPGEVQLDGSASTDPDGDPLDYHWTLRSRPEGSAAGLQGDHTVNPTLGIDRPGRYVVELVADDGQLASEPSTVTLSTENSAPVARAGRDQTVAKGSEVHLDGSASSDIDGQALRHRWEIVEKPKGSRAKLDDPEAVQPRFKADQSGDYTVRLRVEDSEHEHGECEVHVSTHDSLPVADAGPDQTVHLNQTVDLDGSGSTDVDGSKLYYRWSFTSLPDGSTAQIGDPGAVRTSFVADRSGTYVVQLTVGEGDDCRKEDDDRHETGDDGRDRQGAGHGGKHHHGKEHHHQPAKHRHHGHHHDDRGCASDTAVITSEDRKPVADAGPDRTVPLARPVSLDGSRSADPDGTPVTEYRWSVTSAPAGSNAVVSGIGGAAPGFTADLPGTYVIQLIVTSGGLASEPDTVVLQTENSKPVADAGPPQQVTQADVVQLDGSASTDADHDPLTYRWALLSQPIGSTADIQPFDAVAPAFTADLAGIYVAQLIVNDGQLDSEPATTTVTAVRRHHPPTITSTPPVTANAGEAYRYDVDATDPDAGDLLIYSLEQAPAGMTIDAGTGLISWTPGDGQAGIHAVALRVEDSGGLFASQSFALTVVSPNRAPVIDSVPLTLGTVGVAYGYAVTAADPDADPLTYALDVAPAGMSINEATGAILWTPDAGQTGNQAVTVRVSDPGGLFDTQNFTVSVAAPNHPPVAEDDVYTAAFGVPLTVAAPGVLGNDGDADGDGLTAVLVEGPSNGSLSLDAHGGFTYTANPPPPAGAGLNVVLKWSWTGSTTLPASLNVLNTPVVIDLNGDGTPDVVFGSTASTGGNAIEVGNVRALDGKTGTELFTVTSRTINVASSLAVGDIDGDGKPEIVAADSSGTSLLAFEHDGILKWQSQAVELFAWGSPAIADLDGDGRLEIVVGRQVVNSNGTLRWTGAGGSGRGTYGTGGLPLASDIDLDGFTDIVVGNTVYSHDGQIKVQANLTDGFNAVGNFDADPQAEIVLVGSGSVWLLEHDGRLTWGPVAIPGGGHGGPPTIADFDGDGEPEIGVAGATRYAVFETDGSVKWQAVTQDGSSNVTGSSVFDFEGDGSAEVVYRDELKLRVYRGSDGTVLFETPMSSCTWYEYPLVADVDADGHAEIVVGANTNCGLGVQRGIHVFGDRDNRWVPTRKIWNQHSYHITNVNEDGTIPAVEAVNWLIPGLNNFRLNTFSPGDAAVTDRFTYKASDGKADSNVATVTITARKTNHAPVITSTPVVAVRVGEVYRYGVAATDPDAGDALSFALSWAPSGMAINAQTGLISWTPEAAQLGSHTVTARVQDAGGLFAVQTFMVEVLPALPVNHPPAITSAPVTAAIVGQTFSYDVDAIDPDAGDVLTYSLTTAPAGMTIDAADGLIQWTPAQSGSADVSVQVADAGGLMASQSFIITVTAANRPPVITSAPVIGATPGRAYSYQLVASDPDGDALTYELIAAPAGAVLDAVGALRWDRPVAGSHPVTIRVSDGQTYAEQQFTLTVTDALPYLELTLEVTPAVADPGASVLVRATATGGSANALLTATLDGQPLVLDASGQVTLTAGAAGSTHRVTATVTDGDAVITREGQYSVRDAADTTLPVAQITAPQTDAEFYGPFDLIGTATDAHFAYYQLLVRPAGAAVDAWREIGRGYTPVTAGVLGRVDTTVLANGMYDFGLRVVDANGQTALAAITATLLGDYKLGPFQVAFEDLHVDAAGIPIRVVRSYDSLKRHDALDFGWGWSVDYQSTSLRKNMTFGLAWEVTNVFTQFQLCLRPVGQRKIGITLPDGKVERFTAYNDPECATFQVPDLNIRFAPAAGTTSTLEIAENTGSVLIQGGQLYDTDTFGPWNPTRFKLTTEDGTVYILKEGVGIEQIQDPFGNTLSYGPNGIVHSAGLSVAFERDLQGRITRITDPAGKSIQYRYNARGELEAMIDREGQENRFDYLPDHLLGQLTDALGQKAAQPVYDTTGRLIALVDAAGQRTDLVYDTTARQQTVTDRNGQKTTYGYDDQGNVTAVTDPLGNTTTYGYDSLGNETQVTDPLGNLIRRSFDPKTGKQLSETDPLGHVTAYGYDNVQTTQLKSVTDANGNVTNYGYFGSAPNKITEPLGRITSLNYDAKGNLIRLDLAGQASQYGYDGQGHRVSETDPAGHVTQYAVDANGRETERSWTRTDAAGQLKTIRTRRTLDAEGRVLSETDPTGAVTLRAYNGAGKVTQETDPLGRITTFEYDAQARLIKTRYPDGSVEASGYDGNGNVIRETDRAGRVTLSAYDALNRLIKTTAPDGTVTETVYDAAGRVWKTLAGTGATTENTYDGAGRLIAVTEPDGRITRYAYDANGNRTQTTATDGQVTAYQYDALNRLIKTTYPDGTSSSTVWRADGLKQSETDPAGVIREFGYDAIGQLNQVKEQTGTEITVYAYDEAGNKIRQTDAEGRVTRWDYDDANRMTARVLPGGGSESQQYDVAGRLMARTGFDGQLTRYGYDAGDRRNQVIHPDGRSVQWGYTADGQVASVTDALGTTAYQYDGAGRLIRETHPDGAVLAWSYDADGHVSARTTPSGTTRYQYDAAGRLSQVTDPQGQITGYGYDGTGRLQTQTYPNGTQARHAYDANGQLTRLLHLKADGSLLAGTGYTLAAGGKRTELREYDGQSTIQNGQPQDPVRTTAYGYDGSGSLTQETVTAGGGQVLRSVSFAYDKVGNRLQKTETTPAGTATTVYSYDADDRLSAETRTVNNVAATTSYAWDANGRLIKKSEPGQVTLYGWDSEDHLTEVKRGTDESTATTVATYAYDAEGNRIKKTEPATGKVTDFLIDTTFPYAQVVEEKTTLGTQTESTHYVWGTGLIKQLRGGQGTFYHPDGLGSVKALTDANGLATDSYQYTAFGEPLSHTGPSAQLYRFAGEHYDPEAGMQYHRARWYDPATGRFTALDPFEGNPNRPATLHKYAYAGNDPVDGIDPSGRTTLTEQMAAIEGQATLQLRQALAQYANREISRGTLQNVIGEIVENALEQAIKKAFDGVPGFSLATPHKLDPSSKSSIDFLIKVGDKLAYIEAKYQLPTKSSKAFPRLVKQVLTALKSGKISEKSPIFIYGFRPLGERARLGRMDKLLNALNAEAGMVRNVQGLLELVGELRSLLLAAG
jgi:RHS repeat-associated protein